jgi:hypothetical protein
LGFSRDLEPIGYLREKKISGWPKKKPNKEKKKQSVKKELTLTILRVE